MPSAPSLCLGRLEEFVRGVTYFFRKVPNDLQASKIFKQLQHLPYIVSSSRHLRGGSAYNKASPESWRNGMLSFCILRMLDNAEQLKSVQEWVNLMIVSTTTAYLYFLEEALLIFTDLNWCCQRGGVMIL